MTEPASIRYNNPGAMWGGTRISKKWGETGNVGLGRGNHAAIFPDKLHGEFDLWKSNYCGLSLTGAVTKWSGGEGFPWRVN